MLNRCYSEATQRKNPTYVGCYVCEEWLTFSNFKSWMEKQNWEGKELDKDILVKGNKVYSPETCIFIDASVNSFVSDNGVRHGNTLVGASYNKAARKFMVRCHNVFEKKCEYLGYFEDERMAHLVWKKRKHELACQLADLQNDERVASALRVRYA